MIYKIYKKGSITYTNEPGVIKNVTARVVSINPEIGLVNFDYYGKPAYCLFRDMGTLTTRDIYLLFKPNSLHRLVKIRYNHDFNSYKLNYRLVHPETLDNQKMKILPTYSGDKNLRMKLNNLLEGENNEKNRNNFS